MVPEHEKNSVILELSPGTSCTINLHGATVLSWKVNGREQLFVSSKAVFDGKSPIRGGIPIAFPKFAQWGDKPLHGFARLCAWSVEGELEKRANGDLGVTLVLRDTEWTRSIWDYRFELNYTVVLSPNQLKTSIVVRNPSATVALNFEVLFHTYFQVKDVRQCSITGLKGLKYTTGRDEVETHVDDQDSVTVNGFVTRVYPKTSPEHKIVTPEWTLSMVKSNFPDSVVWNPWSEVAKTITDLSDEEFDQFICLEAGNFSNGVKLQPRASFEASQVLRVD